MNRACSLDQKASIANSYALADTSARAFSLPPNQPARDYRKGSAGGNHRPALPFRQPLSGADFLPPHPSPFRTRFIHSSALSSALSFILPFIHPLTHSFIHPFIASATSCLYAAHSHCTGQVKHRCCQRMQSHSHRPTFHITIPIVIVPASNTSPAWQPTIGHNSHSTCP